MSKASRQSLSLLAVVHGCFKSIDDFGLAGETAPTVLYGVEVSLNIINQFPETGDANKNTQWMTERIHAIDEDLKKRKSLYSMIVLTSLMHQIITDLMEKIKDKKKLDLLEELAEIIYSISDMIDEKKNQFEAYEESDSILKKLYKAIEFSR